MQGSAAAFGFLAASTDSGGGAVGRAGQGGGCLVCLVIFGGGGDRVAHRALQGPHLLGWGPAKARAGLSSCREPAGRFSV